MQKRRLGRSDIELPPIMFGGNVFGWTADEATSFKLLDACIAAGVDAIDTADVYGLGARPSGGRVRGGDRQMAEAPRQA